jgi:hypothetical protein
MTELSHTHVDSKALTAIRYGNSNGFSNGTGSYGAGAYGGSGDKMAALGAGLKEQNWGKSRLVSRV